MTDYDFCWKALDLKNDSSYRFLNSYNYSQYQKAISVADKIATDIKSKNVSTKEQIKLASDAICDIAYYDNRLSESDAYGALVRGNTVCSGYADALQVVLEKLGIPCVTITGSSAGIGHAWNHVFVDGKWQLCDLTIYDKNGQGLFRPQYNSDRLQYPKEDYDLFELTYKFY